MTATSAPRYRCTDCGWTSLKWVGRCGGCGAWGTLEEGTTGTGNAPVTAAVPIDQVSATGALHRPTGIGEFDRVLGGGIVPGSVILLSGEPGVGKSTLLLAVAAHAARSGATVLYVSAEESASQVRSRADRVQALDEHLLLASETELGAALAQAEAAHPDLLIIDSVQTLRDPARDGLPGGPTQVKSVAHALTSYAKHTDCAVLLVGHVTKDGTIAGPRQLEHLVDVVCQIEGDRRTALRFAHAVKNRYGDTDEVGCFEMTGSGMEPVPDPSRLFLSGDGAQQPGTAIAIAREGQRSLPVEIQALTVPSAAPQPRRVVNGVDASRLSMLLAVLQQRAGIPTGSCDVYVSTVGGARLIEPGADLAIALAVASAVLDRPIRPDLATVGEVSLAGQIRPALALEARIREATRLGYTNVLEHRGARTVRDAIAAALTPRTDPARRG
ncbi:MAG: DNA repair protein RadA [Microbacteriaceae bacterium]|jgi:DNA repair protein RadA/Sms|nr:DNA repair protein RadA [Microbacteriaceae bacterium]